jgi:hypothetical protein
LALRSGGRNNRCDAGFFREAEEAKKFAETVSFPYSIKVELLGVAIISFEVRDPSSTSRKKGFFVFAPRPSENEIVGINFPF